MNNRRIARELMRLADTLTAAPAVDEWTEYDQQYRQFVEDVVPKYHGRYRDGIAEFPSLLATVEFSGNETKFQFTIGNKRMGRVFKADDAAKILRGLKDILDVMD